MSGLTVGLASIDRLSLEIEAKGNPEAKKQAEKIFPVIDNYHWMLVTLLFCNATAMEALPIALDKLVPTWAAILCSVTGVLVFGEIIPQALCTGPSQNKIAVMMCPIVKLLMYLTFPISWPIAKGLDALMGEHELQRYNNDELKNLILLHSKAALREIDQEHLPEDVLGLDHL
jgi:metal transporter CNNM